MTDRRKKILAAVDDLAGSFLYYDRQLDEELPRGEIEAAIVAGEITESTIVVQFARALSKGLGALEGAAGRDLSGVFDLAIEGGGS